ncbi:MAG TPA: TetR family transcriptional regulator [Pseudogracilibacillus sp.]|nr:TetR family transcriptional regulator [Pseudogracilibacillus sp.]
MSKRTIIIEKAIELFQKQGIDKTTVSHIVKAGNMAQGTFYLYFPSKMALMPAIAEEMVKIMMADIKAKVTGKEAIPVQLETIVERIFFINEKYRDVLAMIYAGLSQTEHLKEWEAVYEPCYDWVTEVIEKGQADGSIMSEVEAKQSAKLLIGLVESSAEQVYLYAHTDEQEVERQKEAVKQFLFHALQVKLN